MTTYVMRNGRLVQKRYAAPLRGVSVISDTMSALKHPCSGRTIDSKSEFRRDTRAYGGLEVGTDPAASREQPRHQPSVAEIVHDVKRSIAELRSR